MPALSPSASRNAWPSVRPTSSTVWWSSTSTSPAAPHRQVEEAVAGEAARACGSRNGTPVVDRRIGRGRRAPSVERDVGLLGACARPCARPRAAVAGRAGARASGAPAATAISAPPDPAAEPPLDRRDRARRAPPAARAARRPARAGASVRRAGADHARALDEVVDAERRREARGAAGRQHVVRARRGSRRTPRARACPRKIAPACRMRRAPALAGRAPQLEVLGREPVRRARSPRRRSRRRRWRRGGAARAAAIARRGSAASWRRAPPPPRGASRRSASRRSARRSGSCSACASRSAATSAGSAVRVGDDQHLARPGDHVDVDAAEARAAWRSRRRRCPGRRSCRRAGSSRVP